VERRLDGLLAEDRRRNRLLAVLTVVAAGLLMGVLFALFKG
jgi:hypothetical protein